MEKSFGGFTRVFLFPPKGKNKQTQVSNPRILLLTSSCDVIQTVHDLQVHC